MQNKSCRKRVRQSIEQVPPESSDEHRIYEQNSQTSPLLRLPPELRLRIYELLFSVGQISIAYRPWDPRGRARTGFYCRTLSAGQNPWKHSTSGMEKGREAHSGSDVSEAALVGVGSSPGSSSGVTLLSGVCRQLYHETAVLPFKLNVWSFVGSRLVERYLKERRMSLRQRRAVRTLFAREKASASVEKSFGGLKVIGWRGDNGRLVKRSTTSRM
ncbi:hypothetical protein RB599_008957 [Gaeumannomyces hyphopodioides]